MEQAIPLSREWLNFNRFRVRAEKTVPVGRCQVVVAAKGGVIVGDLPPYEAFPIGGTSSVRGYSEGGVGSGRRYVSGTAELHIPLSGPLVVRIHVVCTHSRGCIDACGCAQQHVCWWNVKNH